MLQAIHEEPGWGYVRQGHINELLMGKDRALFQWEDNRIRVLKSEWQFDFESPSQALPKILFVAVRRRAHSHVMERGLTSAKDKYLVLTPDRDMALRIGRRRDQKPVVFEIMASAAQKEGISFHPFGNLFLTDEVPGKFVSGPPVSKEVVKASVGAVREEVKIPPDFEAGSFVLDMGRDPDLHRRDKGEKRRGWKEGARKLRKRRGR